MQFCSRRGAGRRRFGAERLRCADPGAECEHGGEKHEGALFGWCRHARRSRGVTRSHSSIERDAAQCAVKQLGKEWPHPNAAAHLLLEADGFTMDRVDEEAMLMGEACMEAGAEDVFIAEDERRMREIWSLRRSIGEAVKSINIYKEEDTVVPRNKIPELIRGVKAIAAKYGLTTICYGHAVDGNIHCNIIKTVDDETWEKVLPKAIIEIFEHTASLGGQVSGEHGIGWVQREYLSITQGAREISLMRGIKQQFDPAGILNPRKVFPD